MFTMNDIDKMCRDYSETRENLTGRVSALEEELEAVRKKHMVGIRRTIGIAAERSATLRAAIEVSRELFGRPKTVVLHGIKVGYAKGRGKIDWTDDDIVVRLIKRHFPDQAEILIKTEKTPIKSALNNLTVQELKKIGVTAEETGEMIVVRPVDTDVDKIVKALLKDQEENQEAAA